MAVVIYKISGLSSPVSHDNSFSNPILWEADQEGGTFEKLMYLRNDTEGTYATDIILRAADSLAAERSDWYGPSAFMFALDAGGSPGDYVPILEIDILDDGQEIPFWLKIDIPQALETGPKADVSVTVNAIIHTVG